MNNNLSKSPKSRFLGAFRGEMQANIIEFGKQLWEKDSDVFIFMARKAACFFDCLRELKIADVRGLAVSDRILDMDLSILQGKKVTLVDDCVFSGTTLYHARDIVLKAGATECDTMTLTINEEWIKPSLLPDGNEADELNFVQPLFKQDDSQCVQQCYDVVQAISLFPRPYDVDFPHTLTSKISNDDLDSLVHCSGWQAYDVSTKYQISQDVRVFTLIPDLHIQRAFTDEYHGLNANIQIAKVRLYARQLSNNSWSIRLVPIVMLGAIQSSLLKGEKCIFGKELEDMLETLGTISPRSRYRLLHFLVSWALLKHFMKIVNDQRGLCIEERLRYDLAEMSFGSKFASISAKVLELLKSVSFLPPAHEPDSPIIALYDCKVKNVENPQELVSACLEPFVWLYKNLEIPARRLVREKGLKACIDNGHNDLTRLTRLRRGFSPQRLIARLHSESFDVVRYVSLFLDKAIDLGIAVPTMVDDRGVLYRAFRHGEDAVFGEAEERLSIIALKAYMENRGISHIYGLELQKFIVLFTQIAVRDGSLLERLNTSESVNIGCRIISIKGYLHGPVPMLTTLDESGTVGAPFVQGNDYPAEWLITDWERKKILSVEKSGSKPFAVTDFKNAKKLVLRLKHKKDAISEYVYKRLDTETQLLIDTWQSATQPTDDFQNALIKNINLIASRNPIWNAAIFKNIKLRSITKNVLKYKKAAFQVNRLLLEDAYSEVFTRSRRSTKYSINIIPDLKIGLKKESQARKIGRCLGRFVGDKHTLGMRPLNNDTDLVLLSTCSEAEHQIRALSGELSIILERWSPTISKAREYAQQRKYLEASEILLEENALFVAINSGAMKYLWFAEKKLINVIAEVAKYADTIDTSGDLRDDWNLLWPEFISPNKSNTAEQTWVNIETMGQLLIMTSVTIRIINYWLVLNAEEQELIKSEKANDVLMDCMIWCDNFLKYCSKFIETPIGEVVSQFKNVQSQRRVHDIGEQCKMAAAYMNDSVRRAIRNLLSESKLLCDSFGTVGEFRPFPYAVFLDIEHTNPSIDPYARQLRLTSDLIGDDARFIENSHNPWRTGLWILVRGNRNATNAVELCHKLVTRCNDNGLRYRAVVLGQLSYDDSIRDMVGSVKLAEGDFFRRIAELRVDVLPVNYDNKVVLVNEVTTGSLSEGDKYCILSELKPFPVRLVKSGGDDLPEKTFMITEVIGSIEKAKGVVETEEKNSSRLDHSPSNTPVIVQNFYHKDFNMRDQYKVKGQIAAVGNNATAENNTFNQMWQQLSVDLDLQKLASELSTLRVSMRSNAVEIEHDQAIACVGTAESAAKRNDGSTTLQNLKEAGKWAFDVATKIGATVAAKAIQTAIGM